MTSDRWQLIMALRTIGEYQPTATTDGGLIVALVASARCIRTSRLFAQHTVQHMLAPSHGSVSAIVVSEFWLVSVYT